MHAFLTSMPARTGKLATVRSNGRAHVVPVWYDVDEDGSLLFTTGELTVKGRNLLQAGRASLCVDDEHPPFSFVSIEGAAEVGADPGDLLYWATRIAGRYMGETNATQFGRRNAVPGELLVRIRADHVTAVAHLAG